MTQERGACYICQVEGQRVGMAEIDFLFVAWFRDMAVLSCEKHFLEYGPPPELEPREPGHYLLARPYKERRE